jgi:hypothetical protein
MGGVRAVFVNARTQRSLGTGEVVFGESDTGAHETPMFALQVMRSLSERLRVAES